MATNHGVFQTNPIVEGYHKIERKRHVSWDHPDLRITRLRLLSDPGYPTWDVSYCHGRIGDEEVKVMLPFSELPKRAMKSKIVQYARLDKVHAKAIGILEDYNISKLC